MANDDLAEATELAETLRATIANMDTRIEERARQILAERRPTTMQRAIQEALEKIEVVGEMMRQDLLDHTTADEQGKDFIRSRPTETWKTSAAKLLLDICEDEYQQHKEREQRG